jgi:signal transduction histidine kinase
MKKSSISGFSITSGTDLAFAIVVLLSYFATFSNTTHTSLFLVTVLVCLGIAYITLGIYGFAFIQQSQNLSVKLIYFLLQVVIGGLIVYFGKGVGINAFILLPLVAHTAMGLDQEWMLITNAGIFITYVISIMSFSNDWAVVWKGLPIFFAGQVFILIFTEMAYTEQKARINVEKMAAELSDANHHLSEYAAQVKDLAISQERNRLAREIHDGLGHSLTTINMQIKAALAIMQNNPEQATHLLETAQQLSSDALRDVRNSVSSLREDNLNDISLVERINHLLEASKSQDREINFSVNGSPRVVSPQIDVSLFRVVQEAINNAIKHSNSSLVKINLSFEEKDQIKLEVEDNGQGTDSLEGGFGLIGMKERIRLINGAVEINSSKGQGFSIKVSVPG